MMPLCIKNDGQQAAAQCLFARYLDCKLATPSAARLLLYSCVQRNMYKIIQRNVWKKCG
ncbi:hypothetical protein T06_2476 [Trichinella sp. T6]|nr:hypothetical protein T06_2476 [Trichinella sp. T6]